MADLKTNYKDDVLNTEVNERRKYQMIQNDDGTVSFVDVTDYSQVGDSFGAVDINATNEKCNELNNSLDKNSFGTHVTISNGQSYTPNSDGYVVITARGGYIECKINNVIMLATHKVTYVQTMSLFVRKGMTLSCYDEDSINNNMEFIPIV